MGSKITNAKEAVKTAMGKTAQARELFKIATDGGKTAPGSADYMDILGNRSKFLLVISLVMQEGCEDGGASKNEMVALKEQDCDKETKAIHDHCGSLGTVNQVHQASEDQDARTGALEALLTKFVGMEKPHRFLLLMRAWQWDADSNTMKSLQPPAKVTKEQVEAMHTTCKQLRLACQSEMYQANVYQSFLQSRIPLPLQDLDVDSFSTLATMEFDHQCCKVLDSEEEVKSCKKSS